MYCWKSDSNKELYNFKVNVLLVNKYGKRWQPVLVKVAWCSWSLLQVRSFNKFSV